jgi:dual-specificity kinase
MSTPSTATATLPPPHQHQYYSRHQAYTPQSSYNTTLNNTLVNGAPKLSAASQYPQYSSNNTTSASDYRRTTASAASAASVSSSRHENRLPPIQNPSKQAPEPADDMSTRSRKKGPVDWNDFYKNGVPREVIVIDDDSPEPQHSSRNDTSYDQHTDKKRKTAGSANYDPVYNPQTSYSTTQTPYYENSSTNHTVSTDRTAPVYKGTGSSSIGPAMTNGVYYQPLDDGAVGQKRKRTTRAAEEAKVSKRRELEKHQSPYSAYVPPPRPPIKAKDVYVAVVKDVSRRKVVTCISLMLTMKQNQKHVPKDEYDDDDGHYKVKPDHDLTDRCEYLHMFTTFWYCNN